jgi:hypothetical protein
MTKFDCGVMQSPRKTGCKARAVSGTAHDAG